jgi:hypothetical protein
MVPADQVHGEQVGLIEADAFRHVLAEAVEVATQGAGLIEQRLDGRRSQAT